ncbi:MAG: bifunctional DNA primase/polymerase [Phycisphaeraceae bacterium]|nr:bifunctional DNA primase/polymerase [Phycisphaeraceae bacterium]
MPTEPNILLAAALAYAELGYAVFPCAPGGKVPLTEHGFLDATTDPQKIEQWWSRHPSANIGMPTEGLIVIDADAVDGCPNPWLEGEPERQFDLAAAPMSVTPRGGQHHVFRQPPNPHRTEWRCTEGRLAPRVDTRADGGYIVVPPSVREDGKAYRWQPTLELDVPRARLPMPPAWLLERLGEVARGCATSAQGATPADGPSRIPTGQRNATLARLAGGMRRMGMSAAEIAAALTQANQARCDPPLSEGEVRRIAGSIARYEPDAVTVALVENHYEQIICPPEDSESATPHLNDPGPVPEEMLRVPGFIGEVMDYCLDTAPYPNPVMAFCGAVSLQAFLAGRRVRDPTDNRTNIYLLGLAHSASGKDWPRKVNVRIAHEIGLAEGLGDRFASGEGIQDALYVKPSMLFQTDEIDGMLQSINKAKDARHEAILSTLLTMYSSANSVFVMRCKAGKQARGVIDQPNLTVFGTAIPNHYYEALSQRMLTNGFFARMIILEAGKRSKGREARITPLPPRVIETAQWWGEFRPGRGNLEHWHPEPVIIPQTPEALTVLVENREEAESAYARAEAASDAVGTTVWGRVSEQARKLAMLHAISANHRSPVIGVESARWASSLVMHLTRRMLFQAQAHVAENPFHAECLKLMQKLRDAPGREMSHSALLKRMKIDARRFMELIDTLTQRGDLEIVTVPRAGTYKRTYRLRE